jgi:uncharacterized protein (DUF486 family)
MAGECRGFVFQKLPEPGWLKDSSRPAAQLTYTAMNLGQLKILQEVIALSVFVPFAVLYMKQPLKLNYLWAALCICAAVYFVFGES